VGLQILSDVFTEDRLLRIARMYEREVAWADRAPALAAEGRP
jgi:Asp-tRNA(Asn)/Glu-tRNA(Gln) amidotransferase A subunit family amidase